MRIFDRDGSGLEPASRGSEAKRRINHLNHLQHKNKALKTIKLLWTKTLSSPGVIAMTILVSKEVSKHFHQLHISPGVCSLWFRPWVEIRDPWICPGQNFWVF